MVGVGKDDLRPHLAQFFGRDAFHSSLCANRHENGRRDRSVRRRERSRARPTIGAFGVNSKRKWRHGLNDVPIRKIARHAPGNPARYEWVMWLYPRRRRASDTPHTLARGPLQCAMRGRRSSIQVHLRLHKTVSYTNLTLSTNREVKI